MRGFLFGVIVGAIIGAAGLWQEYAGPRITATEAALNAARQARDNNARELETSRGKAQELTAQLAAATSETTKAREELETLRTDYEARLKAAKEEVQGVSALATPPVPPAIPAASVPTASAAPPLATPQQPSPKPDTSKERRWLQDDIADLQAQIDTLNAEIADFQAKIDDSGKRDLTHAKNPAAQVNAYQHSIQDRKEKVTAAQTKMDELKRELAALAP